MIELSVQNLARGGLVERIQDEIAKAVANIVDPNTPAKKPRVVTMKMTIKANEGRNMADVSVLVSSTLAPAEPIETGIFIGADPRTGEVAASEVQSGEEMGQEFCPVCRNRYRVKLPKCIQCK